MEGMVIIYQGSRGCGKTLSMVAQSLDFLQYGWKIYSNFYLEYATILKNEEIINLDKSSTLKNCVILVDELQILFDSRNWKDKKSITFSNFIQQIRKRNIVLIGTTQYVDTVEKRIRQHIDTLIKPKYYEDPQVCICQIIDLTSLEDGNGIVSYEESYYAPPGS